MIVRFTPQALSDLRDISEFIQASSLRAAERVSAAIQDAAGLLETFPYAGRRQGAAGIRKLAVRRYPYLIYYTVDEAGGAAYVVSIRHAARRRNHQDL